MNDEAVLREPMTMDDYTHARMVREPYGMFDLDMPVTGADGSWSPRWNGPVTSRS